MTTERNSKKKGFHSSITDKVYPTHEHAMAAEHEAYSNVLLPAHMIHDIVDEFNRLRMQHDAEIQMIQNKYEPMFDNIVIRLQEAGLTNINKDALLQLLAEYKIMPSTLDEDTCNDCCDCDGCEGCECENDSAEASSTSEDNPAEPKVRKKVRVRVKHVHTEAAAKSCDCSTCAEEDCAANHKYTPKVSE